MQTRGMRRGALAVAASVLIAAGARAQPADQSMLKPVLNDGVEAPGALRFAWPMLSVGVGQYEEGPTGVTVFRFGRKVAAAIDVRGGGPGTVNSDYLRLGYETPELDAIVFAGGSWYGLEAVTAVNTALKDDGVRGGAWDNVGLAVGSIIYDFGGRRLNEVYPDKRLAQAALRAARPGAFPRGAHGAGRSAVFGSLFGCNAKSGQGGAFRQVGEVKIAAFTVVNALGVVTDRAGRAVACFRESGGPEPLTASTLMQGAAASVRPGGTGDAAATPERRNTTVSLVVTNRTMSPADLQRLAVQVHTSMARAIQPFATAADGDVLYAVSTGELEADAREDLTDGEIAMIASELMWDAVLSAVPEQPQPMAATAGPQPRALEAHAGDYRFSGLATLRVSAREGRLFGQAVGPRDVFAIRRDAPVELLPAGPGLFTVPGRYPLSLRFGRDRVVINPGRWEQVGVRPRR